MCEEGAADQIANTAGLERGGGLEVFEFEEDAAGEVWSVLWEQVDAGEMFVPSCGFGESGGLDQWGRDPGFGEVGAW